MDYKSIEWYFDAIRGSCFRINFEPGLNPDFDIKNAKTGLYFEIYKGLLSSYTYTDNIGLRIEIRNHDNYPNMFDSFYIDMGTLTNMIVYPIRSKAMPNPYSNCVDIETYSSPLYTHLKNLGISYSREKCLDINTQLLINQSFGCYFFRFI